MKHGIKVNCDASQSGWGIYITWPDGSHSHAQGLWDSTWCMAHINIKELKAALFALQYNTERIKNHLISFYSDNKATVIWINKGTSTRSLKAREILSLFHDLRFNLNLDFKAYYLKGSDNVIADALSRSSLFDAELSFKQEAFSNLCETLNFRPEIDLFANQYNNKCSLYFSSSSDPQALGCDALKHSWNDYKNLYAFPPSHLINRTLYKYSASNCSNMLLIVPRSQQVWFKNIKGLKPHAMSIPISKDSFNCNERNNTPDSASSLPEMIAFLL